MDDPTFINYLRIFYISSQVLTVAIYFYVTTVVSWPVFSAGIRAFTNQELIHRFARRTT